jgi:hypothetical protein
MKYILTLSATMVLFLLAMNLFIDSSFKEDFIRWWWFTGGLLAHRWLISPAEADQLKREAE